MSASIPAENSSLQTSISSSKDFQITENIVYGDPKEIYQDICVLKSLNKAKFPVYLICSRINKQNYAMKVFPYKNGRPHSYFKNEIRFASLHHDNIIRYLYIEEDKDTKFKGVISKVSYTIMEYAPYSDCYDLVMNYSKHVDEILARTYFRQMIDGLEFLHKNGVSHMDIKLENLLIGKNYVLKIADFDLSYFEQDVKIISKGTKFYRGPEVAHGNCRDTKAADIYAAGIVLFTFKTKGMLPHCEDDLVGGHNFSDLLYDNDPNFWVQHCEIQKQKSSFFDDDFKELFIAMTKAKPAERASIEAIKNSKWYNGPVYSAEELKTKMSQCFGY